MSVFRDGLLVQAAVLYIVRNGNTLDELFLAGWLTLHGWLCYRLIRRLQADEKRARDTGKPT